MNYTIYENHKDYIDIQFIAKKLDLVQVNLTTDFILKFDDSNELQLTLDLPLNLTKFLFFYKIASLDLFQDKYKQCYLLSQLIDYTACLLPTASSLLTYFPHLHHLSHHLPEEHNNDLKTIIFGGFEVAV